MDSTFYDTSWTLHTLNTTSPSTSALQSLHDKNLATLAERLHQSHTNQRARNRRLIPSYNRTYDAVDGDEEEDSEDERTGALRNCTWSSIPTGDAEDDGGDLEAQRMELVHEKVTHKFILLARRQRRLGAQRAGRSNQDEDSRRANTILLLSKSTPTTFKHIVSFLQDELDTGARDHDAPATPLKLSGTALQACFHGFIAALASLSPCGVSTSSHRDDGRRPVDVNVEEILGAVKVTVTFGIVVAQAGLKSLEIDLPANSVKGLLSARNGSNPRMDGEERPGTLLALLAAQIEARTGLRLPVASEEARQEEDDPILRITKLTCAAFALSGDGRLKFSSKALGAVRGSTQGERMVGRAQEEMLGRILEFAGQQQQGA